jgi:hypothetical protein
VTYKASQQRRTRQRVAAKSASANPAHKLDREFDDALDRDQPVCWLARFSDTPCSGRLRMCHLIPKSVLLRELPAERSAGAVWDSRVWVWGCGGLGYGDGGHHGLLDRPAVNELRIPRSALPAGLEEFAAEHGLTWFLDRTYRREAA